MSGTDNPEQFEVLKQQKEIIEQGIDLYGHTLEILTPFLFSNCDIRNQSVSLGHKQVQQETKERNPVPTGARNAGYNSRGSGSVFTPRRKAWFGNEELIQVNENWPNRLINVQTDPKSFF